MKFGHCSIELLTRLGMKVHTLPFCHVCASMKSQRHPKAKRSQYTNSYQPTLPLQKLHADTIGPFPIQGWNKERYSLTLVDEISKYIWCFPATTKTQVTTKLLETLRSLDRLFPKVMCSFRTDQGTEFVNSAVDSFLKTAGIRHELSNPYFPPENGLVEVSQQINQQQLQIRKSQQLINQQQLQIRRQFRRKTLTTKKLTLET